MRIGIIGCGNVSDVYFRNAKRFDCLSLLACSDLDPARAQEKAEQHGVPKACRTEELLADPEIEGVAILTPPSSHADLALRAIEAGKHVYTEKPLALRREEGRRILDAASAKQLRVGCAPDTFLGAGLQACRKIIDAGELGRPVAATAFMLCPGHEKWHPDPAFFYAAGGGPLFDMGPYYIAALVNLLGPVRSVTGTSQTSFAERVIETGPKQGEKIAVSTPTHIAGILEFDAGVTCTLTVSFEAWHHQLPHIELYCADGSLSVPDPNEFDGVVRMRLAKSKSWRKVNPTHGYAENSRGLGLADMARAIQSGRPHRASGEIAFHTLDVMAAIHEAAEQRRHIDVASRCEKPARMPQGLAFGQLDD